MVNIQVVVCIHAEGPLLRCKCLKVLPGIRAWTAIWNCLQACVDAGGDKCEPLLKEVDEAMQAA